MKTRPIQARKTQTRASYGLDVILCESTTKTKNIYANTRVIFTKESDK